MTCPFPPTGTEASVGPAAAESELTRGKEGPLGCASSCAQCQPPALRIPRARFCTSFVCMHVFFLY